ncbi:MAG: DAK2 domain-containing protein [Clostridia bacterium]|nr:DAK2 domain-containing protein [Clostridia bacterium]
MSIEIINGELLLEIFKQSTADLNKNKAIVDALNVFPVPDGDTGTNMSLTMNSALAEALKVSEPTVENVSKAISKGSLLGARGNSGVILSQIFRGFAKGCEGVEELDSLTLVQAFSAAREAAYKAVLKPVEGTILTVIRKMSQYGEELINVEDGEVEPTLKETMDLLIKKANETLDRTPDYLDVLKQAGVVDAGGRGLICILDGFHHVISGKQAEDHNVVAPVSASQPVQGKINPDDIKFAYCTEFIIRTAGKPEGSVKAEIEALGDSMVYVEDDDIIKVHIHTNNPGVALEKGLSLGELVNIKIENMKEQHSSIIEGASEMSAAHVAAEKKPYGFLAVAMGDGISNIFKDLGVDYIIEGGQTMNPSTEDIVQGINKVNSDTVFILPNNSNIILAANQAKEISEKEIVVIPTKSIPQGVSAMIAFDGTEDLAKNEEHMVEAIQLPKTIQVTYSVRDTVFNDMEIKESDILGVADGTIAAVGQNVHDVALQVLKNAMTADSEIVTIYYGSDIDEEAANSLAEEIEALNDEVDVEVYYGGQPLYYYIFSVE